MLQGSTVLLRSERAGGGNDRMYRVTRHRVACKALVLSLVAVGLLGGSKAKA